MRAQVKEKSSRSKKGNRYLRSALTEAAQSVRGSKTISVHCIDVQLDEKVRKKGSVPRYVKALVYWRTDPKSSRIIQRAFQSLQVQ
jgi:hypothetical protein